MKTCTECKKSLSLSEFHKSHKSKKGTQIYKSRCKECHRAYDLRRYHNLVKSPDGAKLKYRLKELRKTEEWKTYHKHYRLKYRFGISIEQYENMLEEQDWKCFTCGIETDLCVDHHHESGKVRKLLCRNCNTSLGLLKEDEEILLKMIDYLRMFR